MNLDDQSFHALSLQYVLCLFGSVASQGPEDEWISIVDGSVIWNHTDNGYSTRLPKCRIKCVRHRNGEFHVWYVKLGLNDSAMLRIVQNDAWCIWATPVMSHTNNHRDGSILWDDAACHLRQLFFQMDVRRCNYLAPTVAQNMIAEIDEHFGNGWLAEFGVSIERSLGCPPRLVINSVSSRVGVSVTFRVCHLDRPRRLNFCFVLSAVDRRGRLNLDSFQWSAEKWPFERGLSVNSARVRKLKLLCALEKGSVNSVLTFVVRRMGTGFSAVGKIKRWNSL